MNLAQSLVPQMRKQRPREEGSVPESHKEYQWQDQDQAKHLAVQGSCVSMLGKAERARHCDLLQSLELVCVFIPSFGVRSSCVAP